MPAADKSKSLVVSEIFSPRTAIGSENVHLFAGRRAALVEASSALGRPGSSIVVFGERGAGKTSFGKVLLSLLSGDDNARKSTAKALGIESPVQARAKKSEFRCVWSEIGSAVSCLEDLLYRVLDPNDQNPHSLAMQFPLVMEILRPEYVKIDVDQVLAPSKTKGRRILNASQKKVLILFERAEQLISIHYPEVVPIFFFDELEMLADRRGLGQMIKNRSSSFVLIGIAGTVGELVDDHASASRKIALEMEIPRLNKGEVEELFERGRLAAKRNGVKVEFQNSFIQAIYDDSSGAPARCQSVGAALIDRYREDLAKGKRVEIGQAEYEKVLLRAESTFLQDTISAKLLDKALSRGNARWEILVSICQSSPDGVMEDSLESLSPNVLRSRELWITEMVKGKVLKREEDGKVRFATTDLWVEVRRRIRVKFRPR